MRACRDEIGMHFVGKVVDVGPKKIQVHVLAAYFLEPPHDPVTVFRPHFEWSYPYNWEICK